MKEIIYFTYGDSRKASTWSNVPFLFTKKLEQKGIIVDRVDFSLPKIFRLFFDKIIFPFIGIFYKKHTYTFTRTRFFYFLTNKKIKRAVKKYKNAELCMFSTFSFYNKYNEIPSLLFCDWTYDIFIKERLNRELFFFEKWVSNQERNAICKSKLVISLFPECASSMKISYPEANIQYLNSNVINNLYTGVFNKDIIIDNKLKSKDILFIGGKKYIESAKKLVNSFIIFLRNNEDYNLHLIGIKQNWLENAHPNVHCYGYLKKDVKRENILYYNLLLKSRFLINPTPIWAGYSSTIEAMYFYTPIITTAYKDFVHEFGENIDFGYYIEDMSNLGICKIIDKMIKIENHKYTNMCQSAHNKVSDYTWDSYVDRILEVYKSM